MCKKVLIVVLAKLYLGMLSPATGQQDLYEGSPCIPEYGGAGICKKLVDCPERRTEVELGIRDTDSVGRCGFDGFDEIVCCSPNLTDTDGYRPAQRACVEYQAISRKWPGIIPIVSSGTRAWAAEFPFIAALGFKNNVTEDDPYPIQYNCGGTLISFEHVLTAAHCAKNINAYVPIEVSLGATDLYNERNGAQRISISNITFHPLYKRSKGYHDIAILKLERKVEISDKVQIACLYPDDPWTSNTKKIIVAGWGATDIDNPKSTHLIKSPYISLAKNEECDKFYTNFARLPDGIIDSMLCTMDPNRSRHSDACEGDSGGPLMSRFKRQKTVIGVTALGQICDTATPGVYTAIYPYLEWIEEQVWGKS